MLRQQNVCAGNGQGLALLCVSVAGASCQYC